LQFYCWRLLTKLSESLEIATTKNEGKCVYAPQRFKTMEVLGDISYENNLIMLKHLNIVQVSLLDSKFTKNIFLTVSSFISIVSDEENDIL
jgi:hypothetical protein